MKKISKICISIINIISIIIAVTLLLMSILKTSYIDIKEVTTFQRDNLILNIIILVVFLLILLYIYRKKEKINIGKKFCIAITILLAILCLIYIIFGKFVPTADQWSVFNIAKQFHNGDFSAMDVGGELHRYPNQIGIITIIYYLGYIFGIDKYSYIQFMNIIFLIVSFIFIYKICKKVFARYKSENRNKLTYVFLVMFLPIAFYTTFVYGNIIGFSLSIISLYYCLCYIEDKKAKNILLTIICIVGAVIIKSNYAINLIGIILILLCNLFEDKKYINIFVILLIIVSQILSNSLIKLNIERITKAKVSNGIPKTAWIAMGLQKGDERAEGWYNRYTLGVFEKNEYNIEETNEEAKNEIKERIKYFISNPKDSYIFFRNKIESEWNEPTYQSLWIMHYMKNQTEETYIFDGKINENLINKIYIKYCNIIQLIILFGACYYFILNFRKNNIDELSFAIIFIGGFIFHLFWEAKSQYTITYFILLIPYCINGWCDLVELITNRKIEEKTKQ